MIEYRQSGIPSSLSNSYNSSDFRSIRAAASSGIRNFVRAYGSDHLADDSAHDRRRFFHTAGGTVDSGVQLVFVHPLDDSAVRCGGDITMRCTEGTVQQ